MRSLRSTLLALLVFLAGCVPLPQSPQEGWQVYINEQDGYYISYPPGFAIRENVEVVAQDRTMTGSSLLFPDAVARGTILYQARIDIATGGEDACDLSSEGRSAIHDIPFDRSRWSEGAAGNAYEGTVYSTVRDGHCYRLTLFTHSCSIAPDCGPGGNEPFDRDALEETFEQIVRTFEFIE